MHRDVVLVSILAVLAWLQVSGCATPAMDKSYSAQHALIGKPRQVVLSCAGQPLGETTRGKASVLIYYKEAPMLEESFMGSKGSLPRAHHGCRAKVTLEDDKVVSVTYQSVPSSIGAEDHCEEIFENCVR
jgi:hypothetical protein